jgi:sodium/proline symporter
MSTADGLVISTSQVFANDIYRRSIAPRLHPDRDQATLDRTVLVISRVVTALTLMGAAVLAWFVIGMNVVLLVWVGVGGVIAALMGPLVLGSVWRGVTRAGALAGFWTGAIGFILIHAEIISGEWLSGTSLEAFGEWFAFNAQSPYSAAALAGLTAVAVTVLVSRRSEQLPETHLDAVLGPHLRQ